MSRSLSEADYIARINAKCGDRYTLNGWAGEYNKFRTRASATCNSCSYEWSTPIDQLMKGGGCPKCAPKSKSNNVGSGEYEARINKNGKFKFVAWSSGFSDQSSVALIECVDCSHRWERQAAGASKRKTTGCPQCSARVKSETRRMGEQDRIDQINEIDGVRFIQWHSGYRNKRSKAVCECNEGHQWPASIHHLLTSKSGCPECAKSGFSKSKPATLYILKSLCGDYLKVGITGDEKTRFTRLRAVTPFEWEVHSTVNFDIGLHAAEMESLLHSQLDRPVLEERFEGYTEWFECNDNAIEKINNALMR